MSWSTCKAHHFWQNDSHAEQATLAHLVPTCFKCFTAVDWNSNSVLPWNLNLLLPLKPNHPTVRLKNEQREKKRDGQQKKKREGEEGEWRNKTKEIKHQLKNECRHALWTRQPTRQRAGGGGTADKAQVTTNKEKHSFVWFLLVTNWYELLPCYFILCEYMKHTCPSSHIP